MATLLEILKSAGIDAAVSSIHEEAVNYVCANLCAADTVPLPNVLYIGAETVPVNFRRFSNCGLILPSAAPLPEPGALSCEYCTIPFDDRIALLCQLQETIVINNRNSAVQELRRKLILHKSNLGAVVRHLCELIGNPIAIYDTAYNLLAMESLGLPVDNEVWNTAKNTGTFPADIVKQFRTVIGDWDIASEPFLCATLSWEKMHCLVMQIVSPEGELLGSISVYESFRPFRPEDINIIKDSVRLLADVLAMRTANEDRSVASFLSALLGGSKPDSAEIDLRLKEIGWKKFQLYRLGYIHLADDQSLQRQCEYYCSLFSSVSKQIIAVPWKKNIVLLLCADDQQDLGNLLASLQSMLVGNSLTMGLSVCFSQLASLCFFFESARAALLTGNEILGERPLYLAQDVSFYSLIDSLSPSCIKSFYQSTSYYTVSEYDKAQQTNYCETLVSYFSNMFHSSSTAGDLFIHKNSLLYRLGRVGVLFGIDLNCFHDVFEFWLGYKISIYLNYLDKGKLTE